MKTKFFSKNQVLFLLFVAMFVTSCGEKSKEKKDKIIDTEVAAKAETLNKQCPIKIDQFTRWDGCVGLPGKIIQYNYTVIGTTISPEMKAKLVTNQLQIVKNDKSLKDFREKEVIFRYCYKDYQGLDLCSYDLKPEDYNENYFKEKAVQEKKDEAMELKKQKEEEKAKKKKK